MIGLELTEALKRLAGKETVVVRAGGLADGDTELVLRVREEGGRVVLVTGLFKRGV